MGTEFAGDTAVGRERSPTAPAAGGGKTTMTGGWTPIELRMAQLGEAGIDAVHAVATSEVPAAIVRGAYPARECRALLARLFERKLFVGYEEHGKGVTGKSPVERFDIGASLGNFGGDAEGFFSRSRETNALYATLFEGLRNPIDVLYGCLARLSKGRKVSIAHEPDGRLYGPAIFRCHMPRWGYPPHIDSVRTRERRTDYAVHRFEHQLGGILLLQSPDKENGYRDAILYKCPWTQEIEDMMEIHYLGLDEPEAAMLNTRKFEEYVEAKSLPKYEMHLSPGDLYFFRSDVPHRIPGFAGQRPRITLATFIGYSPCDPEIMVWS